MSYLTFAILPSRDVRAGSYDRGGLRSTRHSTITGILGAVTWIAGQPPRAWVGPRLEEGGWSPLDDSAIAQLIQYLHAQQASGCVVVSWDGMQETFAILSKFCETPSARALCEEVALSHVDIAFQMFCSRGFVAPLRGVLESMSIEDKTHGRATAFAKSSWDKGEAEQRKLLGVAREIAYTLGRLYGMVTTERNLTWRTKVGADAYWTPETLYDVAAESDRLLMVSEALELPPPDVSWMTLPFKKARGDYLIWLAHGALEEPKSSSTITRVDEAPMEAVEDIEGPTTISRVGELPLKGTEEAAPEASSSSHVVLDLADPIARFAAQNYALLIRNTQEALAKDLLARIRRFET